MALTKPILYLTAFMMFFDQLGKCCCFLFEWVSFYCCCQTSFNPAFTLWESRVARFVCFSIFCSVYVRRILGKFCTCEVRGRQRSDALKFIVWIFRSSDCLMLARCGFAPAHACSLPLFSCAVCSFELVCSFYPSILARFVIKHFS